MNLPASDADVRTKWGYEIKLLASDAAVEAVLDWARATLAPTGERPFPIRSLYFDTPDLDIYHRTGKQGRRKYRVRRCGEESVVALERKTKSKGRVRERRTIVAGDDLPRLRDLYETAGWDGEWFQRDLLERRLEPVCRIDYERLLHEGVVEGQPVRLTVDRHVRCAPASGIDLADEASEVVPVLHDNIVEIHFAAALPAGLKTLLRDLNLSPRGVSKYRLGIEACGLGDNAYAR